MFRLFLLTFVLVLPPLLPISGLGASLERGAFGSEVQPILAKNCFACHGPDESSREADLRLDLRTAAVEAGVIDESDYENSELLARIESADPDLVMPPPDSGKSLTKEQRSAIRNWIRDGAEYSQHWAFVVPSKAPVPEPSNDNWSRGAIDKFVLAKMKSARLAPNKQADRYTLVRRLYQDLVGRVPTIEQADEFVDDVGSDSYSRLVDRLLASPEYGQHWARTWLDLARYSDTNGYEKDRPRSIWPYRDWVVNALNADMPYDQFSIEQLAGDMLPNAMLSQRVATGFHRNTMLNEEGGIDPLEYRFYAMVDRVATTGTVWMGLTIGCAQCHTHKYDPISHTDYYSMMALLDNADEPDLFVDEASGDSLHQKIKELEANAVARILSGDRKQLNSWIAEQKKHAATWNIARPVEFRSNLPKLSRLEDDSVFASGDFTKRDEYVVTVSTGVEKPIAAIRIEALPDDRLPASGPGRTYYEGRKGQFFLSEMQVTRNDKDAGDSNIPISIRSASFSNSKTPQELSQAVSDNDGSSGWSNGGDAGQRHVLVATFEEPVVAEQLDIKMLFERHFVASLGRFRISVTTRDGDVRALSVSAAAEQALAQDSGWTQSEWEDVAAAFLRDAKSMAKQRKQIEDMERKFKGRTITLAMQERAVNNPRKTFRHHRGEWLSPREPVEGAVPAIFSQLADGQNDRLGFARWLVSTKNPLFARVVANRAWRHFMGDGLARSDGDFGTQASAPTHPELLDWLAVDFVEQGMSLKHLHRHIVLSATYRQSSNVDDDKRAADPQNEFFARGPRHRIQGEAMRDAFLLAGGVMSTKMGGPSVRPPQPASVTSIAYGNTKWDVSKGEDRYRRSLYTFSKRTAPFAAFTTFDGPSGETCIAKRNRSNTPLQALTLLNDEMFVELAQHLGRAAMNAESSAGAKRQVENVFRSLLTRPPSKEELQELVKYHARQLRRLEAGELDAKQVAGVVGTENGDNQLAAIVMVARVVMNLDETIAKH